VTRPSNAIALLRALVAAAWADSELSQSEVNYIKELARRFHLDDDEWFALQPWLEDPPDPEETRAVLEDLLSAVGSARERDEVTGHIRAVLEADERLSDEEREFLGQYEALFHSASSVDLLLGRLKGLISRPPARHTIDLDEFLRNKILFKLRRRVGEDQLTPEMHRLALVGGLMGIVAHADGEIDEQELELIRTELERRGRFEPETLGVLVTIIREESVRGLDRYRLIAEYTAGATFEERTELLDLLFLVASADGGLTHAELEELRSISSALQLSHREYIRAKVQALES
jgi:uncharacterized tellurite resistance protein B-like protein